MSWHCSLALVEEFSEQGCLDGDAYAQLKSIRIAERSSYDGKKINLLIRSQYGTMYEHSTAALGVERWMSSLPGSHASRSVWPDSKEDKTTNGTCGQTPSGSFGTWDQNGRCWRTSQGCLFTGTAMPFSESWPRQGTIVNGVAYRRQVLARTTNEIGCGLWPTPTVCGNHNLKGTSKTSGDGLATAVKRFPTPVASYWKGNGKDNARLRGHSPGLPEIVGGKLNPMWVEWLMGFPIGWTELRPLAMGRFQQWLQKHSTS